MAVSGNFADEAQKEHFSASRRDSLSIFASLCDLTDLCVNILKGFKGSDRTLRSQRKLHDGFRIERSGPSQLNFES
jgi:hypothetical protein